MPVDGQVLHEAFHNASGASPVTRAEGRGSWLCLTLPPRGQGSSECQTPNLTAQHKASARPPAARPRLTGLCGAPGCGRLLHPWAQLPAADDARALDRQKVPRAMLAGPSPALFSGEWG